MFLIISRILASNILILLPKWKMYSFHQLPLCVHIQSTHQFNKELSSLNTVCKYSFSSYPKPFFQRYWAVHNQIRQRIYKKYLNTQKGAKHERDTKPHAREAQPYVKINGIKTIEAITYEKLITIRNYYITPKTNYWKRRQKLLGDSVKERVQWASKVDIRRKK